MRAPERPRPLRGLLAATSFLTRLPLGAAAGRVTEADLATGAVWFPVVGGVVGLVGATAGWLMARRASSVLAAVVTVGVETIATGVLHLDGLADTADALGAASTGRDGLRAMRDPAIGVFGATALVLDLALRIGAVAQLLANTAFPWAVAAAAGAARMAPLALASRLPYLRAAGGRGSWVAGGVGSATLVAGCGLGLAIALLAGVRAGAAIVLTVCVATFLVGAVARRSFGGVTGDVFGAAAELSQTLGLLAAAVATGR